MQPNRSVLNSPVNLRAIDLEDSGVAASASPIEGQHYLLAPELFERPLQSQSQQLAVNFALVSDLAIGGFTFRKAWMFFAASVFLVSVPVFFQAPLVRFAPGVSLILTVGLVFLSLRLMANRNTHLWGDLLLGFTGSWFAGSVYWGWLRWEPLLHIPIESICLPLAIWAMFRGRHWVGSLFYVGSLMGTAVTDFYFYMVDLIPHWRQLMHVEPEFAIAIYQDAVALVETQWGISWIVILLGGLLVIGLLPMLARNLGWWAFSGAVLGTLLVDGLFWLAANSI